jgi:hypothetical protein
MRKLVATTALALVLSLSLAPSVFAQDSNTGNNAGQGNAASGAGNSDTGGTTGSMTTTPGAKSDDAGAATAGDHGCTATEMWDTATMKCVPK